ncbi:MAG: metal ABC transporter ATP-binding protein [Nitrospirae bacterium]|nr:metal ABC transporter ATP-binding protein [Nitrospirota bacterium]MBF0540211.1 metal ABC transporter ATP-binding protein [Nitrospirota bacterium]
MTTMIETKDISVFYGHSQALKEISFIIESGDFVGLAGPNGAGKTTLIKAVLNLLPLSTGEIKLFGIQQKKFDDWGKIGYLPQKISTINPLFPATVDEVVMLGLLSQKKWPKRTIKQDQTVINEVLDQLGIIDLKKRMLSELSGGQQQKVLLARTLVSNPSILIFDEPSTALDPESRETFYALMQRLNKKDGITIILITHDTASIGSYANKLLYIDKSIIYFGMFSDFCKSEDMNTYFGKFVQHLICHQHS